MYFAVFTFTRLISKFKMPIKIKKGKVGRPPLKKRKARRIKKKKSVISIPEETSELTVEQEAKVDGFVRRVLKLRQIRTKKELFEQMNQIRKHLADSLAFGDLRAVRADVSWWLVWKRLVEKVL